MALSVCVRCLHATCRKVEKSVDTHGAASNGLADTCMDVGQVTKQNFPFSSTTQYYTNNATDSYVKQVVDICL